MTHYIKIQFLEKNEGKYSSIALGEAYLETLELLNASIENAYDVPSFFEEEDEFGFRETTEVFDDIFEFISSKSFGGEISYECVQVNFEAFSDRDLDFFLQNFLSLLKDEVQFLWKFHDTRNLQIREDFFRRLYNLEMDLREILSYIFFKTYLSSKDLLKDLQVSKFNKKIQEIENDFFDISFSSYKDLLNLRKLKDEDREKYLQESNSFDDWKNNLLNRGIQEEIYKDFISSVNDELGPIEEFRNCIMHNRGYDEGLYQNFETNYATLNKKLEEFREIHINEFGNELDLVIGKGYKSIGTHRHFTNGNTYVLKDIAGSDAIFVGDDGQDYDFFDKEFYEYWQL